MALWRQIFFAIRNLNTARGFATTAIFTLGVSSATLLTIIALSSAVFFKPLPWPNEDRLYLVNQISHLDDYSVNNEQSTDVLNHWYQQQSVFSSYTNVFSHDVLLEDTASQPLLFANFVTPEYFDILDVPLLKGKAYKKREDALSAKTNEILISESVWRDHFSRAEDIIGTTISVNLEPRRIVGVVAEQFAAPKELGGSKVGIWIPWSQIADQTDWSVTYKSRRALGVLKQGVSVTEAERTLSGLLNDVQTEWKAEWPQLLSMDAKLTGIREVELGDLQVLSQFMLAAAMALLIIAVANTSNLFFTRIVERNHTIALHAVLGAKKRDLFRSSMMESLVICLLAVLLGLAVSSFILSLLPNLIKLDVPMLDKISLDAVVVLSAVVIAIALTLVFSFSTLGLINFSSLKENIQSSGKGTTRNVSSRRLQIFVFAQVFIAGVVLVGGSLFLAKALSVKTHDLGLDTEGLYQFHAFTSVGAVGEIDAGRQEEIEQGIKAALMARGDVSNAAVSLVSPLRRENYTRELKTLDGRSLGVFPANFVGVDFFSTTAIQLLQGRFFLPDSGRDGKNEIIVSKLIANTLGGENAAIGQRLTSRDDTEYEIVGVVSDGFHPLHFDINKGARVYFTTMNFGFPFVVKMKASTEMLKSSVVDLVEKIDESMMVYEFHDVDKEVREMLFIDNLLITLITALMLVTLVLAFVGIFGVVSYNTGLRRYEIAIRIAVGAKRRDIYQSFSRRVATSMAAGVVLSALGVYMLTHILPADLGHYMQFSPAMLVAMLCSVVMCTIVATLLPLHKVVSQRPQKTLKSE